MTNFESLSLVLAAVQTIAIVGSLYAVWRQLKQFNLNMQHDAYSKHIEDYARITQLLIDKPVLNEIFYSKNLDFGKLPAVEKDFYNYLAIAIGFLERLYLLYKKGVTDKDTWAAWERWFTEQWFPLEIFEVFWKNEGPYFITPFYEHVNIVYAEFKKRAQIHNPVVEKNAV